jgi:Tfp pilus assembly protein PilF
MKGDTAGAKKYYAESARISPRFDDAKLNLAAIYISEQNYNRADSLLDSLFHDSERRTSYQRIVDAMKGTVTK